MPYGGSYFDCDEENDPWIVPPSQQHPASQHSADIPADGGGYYPMPTVYYGEQNTAEELESYGSYGVRPSLPSHIDTPEGGGGGGDISFSAILFAFLGVLGMLLLWGLFNP